MAGDSGAPGLCPTTKVYWQEASLAGVMSMPRLWRGGYRARGRGQSADERVPRSSRARLRCGYGSQDYLRWITSV